MPEAAPRSVMTRAPQRASLGCVIAPALSSTNRPGRRIAKTKSPLFRIDRLLLAALTTLAIFATSQHLGAQVTLSGTNYFQDFNSLGSGLPTGWTTRTNVSSTSLGSSLDFANTNPAAAVNAWSNTTGGFKNFASATGLTNTNNATQQAAATNRALGFKPTAAFGDTNVNFVSYAFQLNNTLGFNNFNLSMDAMMVAAEGRTNIWTLDYGIGSSPTSFTTLTNWTTPTTFGTTALSISSESLTSIANLSENVWFRFSILSPSTGSGSRDSVAIDNFSLTYSAIAAALNWAGGSGNWSDGFGGTVTNGSALSFSGAGGIATNNLVAPVIASMTFSNGAGSYTIAGNAFTISNGIVNNSASAQIFSNAITLGAAQTFNAASGAITFAGDVDNATFQLTMGGSSNSTVSGIISGSGGLTKSGTGTAFLSGANTYSGGTLVSAGVLQGDTTSLQGAITNNASIVFNQSTNGAYGSVLSGSGTLIKIGASTLTLSAANDFTGAMSISNGAVRLSNATGAGTTAGGITVANGAALELTGGIAVGAEALALNGSGISSGGALRSVSGNNSYAGAITLGSASSITTDANTFTISGGITGTGLALTIGGAGTTVISTTGINTSTGGTVVKNGTGTVTVSAASSFTGAVEVNEGVFRVANNTALGTTAGGVTVASGAVLELSNSVTVGAEALTLNGTGIANGGALRSISGNNTYGGAITLASDSEITSTTATLTLSGAITGTGRNLIIDGSGNVTMSGALNTSTGGSLTKTGAGVLTMSAAGNFTGGTTLSAGTIRVGNDTALGTGALNLNAGTLASSSGTARALANNIVLGGNLALADGTGTGALSFSGTVDLGAASRTLTVSNTSTFSGIVSGAAGSGLAKAGAGTLILSGANSFDGAVAVNAGALRAATNATALGTTGGGVTVADGAALELAGGISVGAEALSLTGTGIGSTGALRSLSGANSFAGAISLGGATDIASDGGTLTLSGGITGAGHALTIEGAGNVVITNTGINTGSGGSLAKTGTGALVIAAASDYTGATTIGSGGEIIAAHANALGTTAGGTTVDSGAGLWLSNNITIGAEALSLVGTGVASDGALRNISGNNTFGGAISLGGATTIQSDSGTSLTLSGGITGAGQALTIRGTGETTISGSGINTGSGGTLIKNQSGALNILASSDFTGGSTLSSGTTRVGNNAALGTGVITTSGGAVLASDSATARTLANNFTISGTTTFGEAAVGTGDLTLEGTFNLGGSPRTINVANTLTTINGVISGTSGNSLTKGGTGSLVLNAANTYSGATTVSAGTLALGATGTIASSLITVDSEATLDLTAKTSGYSLGNATLGGVGTVNTASGQTLSIGTGSTIRPATASTSGTLTVSGLTFGSGGTYAFSIGNVSGSAGTAWDLLSVGSAFDITATSGSKFTINVGGNSGNPTGFSNTGNYSWDILTLNSGTISGFDPSKFNLVNNFVGSSGSLSLTSDGSKLTLNYAAGDATIVAWSAAASSAWLTAGNWTGGVVPTEIDVAQFGLNPTPGTTVGINMGNNSGAQSVGAIEVTSARASALTISNSSGTVNRPGILTLAAAKLNSVDNVVLRNNSSQLLSLADGSVNTMGVALGNATDNVVLIDSTGGITISSIISGDGRKLTKAGSGAGILTLSGANTFSGGVDLDTGTLRLNNAAAAGTGTLVQADGTSTLQINVAGTIANNMSLYNVVFLQGANLSGNITLNNTTFVVTNNVTATNSGILSGGGGVQKIGAGTLVLSGANTYTGSTSISNGTISVSADNNLGAVPGAAIVGHLVLDGGKLLATTGFTLSANRGISLGAGNGTIEVAAGQGLSYGGIVAGSGSLTKLGAGSLTLSGANTYSGGTLVSAGALVGSTASLAGPITNNSTIVFDQATNGTFAGTLSGGGVLVKSSGGTLIITNTASQGGVNIAAGTLQIGNGGSTGSITGPITNNGTLTFNRTGTLTHGDAISGSGSLVKLGSGTLTLSASNSYSGGTLLNGGTLTAGNNDAFGTGGIAVGSGTFLNFSTFTIRNAVTNNGGTILSSGTLDDVVATSGTTDIGGANSSISEIGGSATVTVTGSNAAVAAMNGGTLNVNAAGTVVTNYNGGNIGVSNSRSVTLLSGTSSGSITGAGGMTKSGPGILTLNANNTYAGATTVAEGKLVVNGSISSATTVESGAALGGVGTVGATTILSGATITPGNSSGTLNINGDLTWSAGGNYNWEIFNVSGGAGTGWDLINVQSGGLIFSGLSAGTPFNINIFSPSGTNPAGLAPNTEYTWKILQHNTAITGFNANYFNLNSSSFVNNLTSGLFTLELRDGDTSLNLIYNTGAAVPEPGTWAAAALLTAAAGYVRWRRRLSLRQNSESR